jgi:hypothetical protein
MKSSQTGISEICLAELFALADMHKGNHLYVFPATKQLNTFVTARVLDSVEINPYLNDIVDGQRSKQLIKVRDNFVYFRGSTSKRDVVSVDASCLWLDERDMMDQETVDVLHRRTEGQSVSLIREIGNPVYPGTGISEVYYGSDNMEGSDQRKYFLTCGSCNHKQWLKWEDERGNLANFLNRGTDEKPDVQCICRKCYKELDRTQVGEWVSRYPSLSHDIHGYHIAKWYHPYANLNRLYRRWNNPRQKQAFYNHDAGEAYAPPGSKLLEEHILAARGNHRICSAISHGRCTMGVDVGGKHYYWVSIKHPNGGRRVLAAGELDTFEEIGRVIERFNVNCCVIDQYPEVEEVIRLKKKYKGRVWSAEFPMRSFDKDPELLYKHDRSTRSVDINRPLAMSYLQDEISSGMVEFPIDIAEIDKNNTFIKHMITPARVRQEDEAGEVRYVFPKTGKPDHYFFAGLYDMLAAEIAPRGQVITTNRNIWTSGVGGNHDSEFGRVVKYA